MSSDVDGRDLCDAAQIGRGSLVALIGAGGKTTTMLTLAASLGRRGLSVIVTTTTKIWPVEDVPTVLVGAGEANERHLLLTAPGSMTVVASARSSEGKLLGLDPGEVCSLRSEDVADVWLVEADGASGRSLKVHAAHEPVIPAGATHVLIVMGADAIGRPAGEAVHRPDDYFAWRGREERDTLTEDDVVALFLRAGRHLPAGSAAVYILNRVDASGAQEAAGRIQQRLVSTCPGARAFLTVRGVLVGSPGGARS